MSESLFPPDMAAAMSKYQLEFNFMNPTESVVALVNKAWEIDGQIQAAKSDESGETKASNHPYDVKAGKDKKAQAIAADLIKGFVAACDNAITKNKNVAHFLQEIGGELTGYFTYEVQYYRLKEAPAKAPTSNSKLDELKSDRKVLVQSARMFLTSMPGIANAKSEDGEFLLKHNDDGTVKLPNLQGAGVRTVESPTGRWAKYLREQWSIDDKELPIGTDPREMVRMLWSPIDRQNHKPAEIFEAIDKARKATKDSKAPVSVTINGHKVEYRMVESK